MSENKNSISLEKVKNNIVNYREHNKFIASSLKIQLHLLYELLKYCQADDYEAEIKFFTPKSSQYDEENLDEIKGILIIDKNFGDEKVYLIMPDYLFPLGESDNSNSLKETFSYSIRSIKQSEWTPRNECIHWFDDLYNEYGEKFMKNEECYNGNLENVLSADCFIMILHPCQVQEVTSNL